VVSKKRFRRYGTSQSQRRSQQNILIFYFLLPLADTTSAERPSESLQFVIVTEPSPERLHVRAGGLDILKIYI